MSGETAPSAFLHKLLDITPLKKGLQSFRSLLYTVPLGRTLQKYLALIEVDQRQRFIFGSDKLLEMLGASRIIAQTIEIAKEEAGKSGGAVQLIWPVSVLWLSSENLVRLADCVWEIRKRVHCLGLSVSIQFEEYDAAGLTETVKKAERNNRANKDHKARSDGPAALPLFRHMQHPTQPLRPADQPGTLHEVNEPRRLIHKLRLERLANGKGYQEQISRRYAVKEHEIPTQF